LSAPTPSTLPIVLADAPVQKDVVIAALGAAAALGGFVLVFLGIVFSALGGFPGDTPAAVTKSFKNSAKAMLAVFVISLVSVFFSGLWLVLGSGDALFVANIGIFAGLLVALVVVAIWVSTELMG